MQLLLDANISWRITKSLKTEFDEVFHILDFLPHNAKDSQIWELAKSKNLIIVTNDEDFLNLSMTKGWPPKVILITNKQHLHRYCDEFAYQYNTRKIIDMERFDESMKRVNGRLKYADLILNNA